ncbi:hypothetical protein BC829DRAFT_219475 [Chytridium lagenaria]|nr:hypothetical protein BC829DRAFT_219475 [Chytridium lagenaria]
MQGETALDLFNRNARRWHHGTILDFTMKGKRVSEGMFTDVRGDISLAYKLLSHILTSTTHTLLILNAEFDFRIHTFTPYLQASLQANILANPDAYADCLSRLYVANTVTDSHIVGTFLCHRERVTAVAINVGRGRWEKMKTGFRGLYLETDRRPALILF